MQELPNEIRTNSICWIQCEINLPRSRGWLVQPKWCTHKLWTTYIHKTHHNIDLRGVIILFPIMQFLNGSGGCNKVAKISILMGIILKLGHICLTLQNGHSSFIMNLREFFHGTHEIKGFFFCMPWNNWIRIFFFLYIHRNYIYSW